MSHDSILPGTITRAAVSVGGGMMTRFWANGTPITVYGNLDAFAWAGKRHRIERIAEKWRVDEGWWTERQWREYTKVITETGLLAIIFQDLVTGQWYLQRLYD